MTVLRGLKSAALAMLFSTVFTTGARSDDLSPVDKVNLSETQQMLKDPKARVEGVKLSTMGPAVDEKVHELGGQHTDDIYALASDIFADLMKEANGDPLQAQKLLMDAQKNPEGWAAKWSPEQKAKLESLSKRLPAAAAPAVPDKP